MPRPDLTTQRSQEIIEAFISCIARYGLEGATLERVAVAAGVKRTLIRHYLGNRDKMIDALVEYLYNGFDLFNEQLPEQGETLSGKSGVAAEFLHWLFLETDETRITHALAYLALSAATDEYTEFRSPLKKILARFLQVIDERLQVSYPGRPPEERKTIALAITSIYFSSNALNSLDANDGLWQSSYRSALLLGGTLKT